MEARIERKALFVNRQDRQPLSCAGVITDSLFGRVQLLDWWVREDGTPWFRPSKAHEEASLTYTKRVMDGRLPLDQNVVFAKYVEGRNPGKVVALHVSEIDAPLFDPDEIVDCVFTASSAETQELALRNIPKLTGLAGLMVLQGMFNTQQLLVDVFEGADSDKVQLLVSSLLVAIAELQRKIDDMERSNAELQKVVEKTVEGLEI